MPGQTWTMHGPPKTVDLVAEDGRRQRAWEWPVSTADGTQARIWVLGFATDADPGGPPGWRVEEPEELR